MKKITTKDQFELLLIELASAKKVTQNNPNLN